MKKIIILSFCLYLLIPSRLFANDYFVNNAGDDTNSGASPAQAWRTTSRVNTARFKPGDRILLAGGQYFTGGIYLQSTGQTPSAKPVVVRSYGLGRATIQSGDSFGFYAHNTAGIELRQLAFIGSGRLSNRAAGVIFYLDSANANLHYLRLDSLEVRGFQKEGISIGSWNGYSGFTDVRLTNCQLHANGVAGLSSYAFYPLAGQAHHNWYVGNCTTYDNAGRADITDTHTGNGIVLSGIDGALIEKCLAYHNGWLNANPGGGPVGIWGWSCNNLVIQQCESHHNLSGTAKDGGGFDLDGGCTNSVLQYNYSHDNQGPGYLLAQFEGAPAMHDLTIRYNISENDAQQHAPGAIEIWSSGASGGIERADIYNNTVLLARPDDGSSPKGIYVASGGIAAITLRNNILQTAVGLPVLSTQTTSGLRLEGNCYWSPDAVITLDWSGARYPTLAAWRAATGQELLDGGTRTTGICADPCLLAPGATNSPGSGLAGYNPGPTSASIGSALNLLSEFGLDPGPRDFFGNPTPTAGTKGNIGASEKQGLLPTTPATKASTAWCSIYPTVVRNEIHLVSDLILVQAIDVQLIDQLGRSCQSWTLPNEQLRAGGVALPVAGLSAGRYTLRVQSGTHLLRQSLVVAPE